MYKDVGYGSGGKEKAVFYYMSHTFYRSIFDYYMESTYFNYDWENFFIHDIGLCEKNDRCGQSLTSCPMSVLHLSGKV